MQDSTINLLKKLDKIHSPTHPFRTFFKHNPVCPLIIYFISEMSPLVPLLKLFHFFCVTPALGSLSQHPYIQLLLHSVISNLTLRGPITPPYPTSLPTFNLKSHGLCYIQAKEICVVGPNQFVLHWKTNPLKDYLVLLNCKTLLFYSLLGNSRKTVPNPGQGYVCDKGSR